jgi:hypothetical protein
MSVCIALLKSLHVCSIFVETTLAGTDVKGFPIVTSETVRTLVGYIGRTELRYVIGKFLVQFQWLRAIDRNLHTQKKPENYRIYFQILLVYFRSRERTMSPTLAYLQERQSGLMKTSPKTSSRQPHRMRVSDSGHGSTRYSGLNPHFEYNSHALTLDTDDRVTATPTRDCNATVQANGVRLFPSHVCEMSG